MSKEIAGTIGLAVGSLIVLAVLGIVGLLFLIFFPHYATAGQEGCDWFVNNPPVEGPPRPETHPINAT